MHWIEKFRREYKRKDGRTGIIQEELAKMVRKTKVYCVREGSKRKRLRTVGCSEVLIEILEHGGITHPNIAEAIATVCGATEEQRNSIVHEKYHGEWQRTDQPAKPRSNEERKKREEAKLNKAPKNEDKCKIVVQIGVDGTEMKRYKSLTDAAKNENVVISSVSIRCNHRISEHIDEFAYAGCTWRFAHEWDAMNEAQRQAEVQAARGKNGKQVTV